MADRHTFTTIDGLRGIAAVVVVLHHGTTPWLRPSSGYLAVDLFFILSGFVLAYSNQDRLRSLRDFWPYFVRRMIRLYPLYCFGLAMGLLAYIGPAITTGTLWPRQAILTLVFNAAFLPVWPDWATASWFGFPLNPPAWSLAWEVFVSIAFGLVAPFLNSKRLLIILTLAAIGIVALLGYQGNVDGSSSFWKFGLGAIRVAWGFFCGVGLFYLFKAGKLPKELEWVGGLGLLVVLFFPLSHAVRPWAEGFALLVVLPLTVAVSTGTKSRPVLDYFGRISFALYVVHWPIRTILDALDLQWGTIGLLAVSVVAASVITKVDELFRKRLTLLIFRHRPARPATST